MLGVSWWSGQARCSFALLDDVCRLDVRCVNFRTCSLNVDNVGRGRIYKQRMPQG